MSGTAKRLGRDAHQNLTHPSSVEANQYVGPLGEITVVRDEASEQITAIRVHNGATLGGFAVPVDVANSVTGILPNAKVVPPIVFEVTDASQSFTINHGLGYLPIVQLTTGVTPTVQHDDLENVTLTFAEVGTHTVLLR